METEQLWLLAFYFKGNSSTIKVRKKNLLVRYNEYIYILFAIKTDLLPSVDVAIPAAILLGNV